MYEHGHVTYAEFVAYAQSQQGRFEFVDGQIVAMEIPATAMPISSWRYLCDSLRTSVAKVAACAPARDYSPA